eukprot:1156560-Pelagomonas_calceolata.AAC.1
MDASRALPLISHTITHTLPRKLYSAGCSCLEGVDCVALEVSGDKSRTWAHVAHSHLSRCISPGATSPAHVQHAGYLFLWKSVKAWQEMKEALGWLWEEKLSPFRTHSLVDRVRA